MEKVWIVVDEADRDERFLYVHKTRAGAFERARLCVQEAIDDADEAAEALDAIDSKEAEGAGLCFEYLHGSWINVSEEDVSA